MPYKREQGMESLDAVKLLDAFSRQITDEALERNKTVAAMMAYPFTKDAAICERENTDGLPSIHVGSHAGISAELAFLARTNTYIVIFRNDIEELFTYPTHSAEEAEKKVHGVLAAVGQEASPPSVRDALEDYMRKRKEALVSVMSKTVPRPGSDTQTKFYRMQGLCFRTHPGLSMEHVESISAAILSIAYQPKESALSEAIFMESPAVMPNIEKLAGLRPATLQDGYFLMGEMARGHAARTAMLATSTPWNLIPQWMGYNQIREISKVCARVMERKRVQLARK